MPVAPAPPNWTRIVERIRADDPEAVVELYQHLKGLRWYLYRQIGPSADDEFQNVMTDLVIQIRRGDLRNPEALTGYVRSMAHRRAVMWFQAAQHARECE